MITHVKFASIPTADQTRALAFWTEKMGFTLLTSQPFDDTQRWIELSVGNSDTRLVLFVPSDEESDRIGRCFYGALACDDVEATCHQLAERGVELTAPPTQTHWGSFAKFKDPDGNEFVLSSR
jgi:predicted enzyme related to lactoylglutathione lyase